MIRVSMGADMFALCIAVATILGIIAGSMMRKR